ncbi:MAG: bile acid:sodium symporter family protein [Myxococcales bacterium]|nr:bile acid:sodium symporter family protein [Myxococcales bacterium]
MFDWFHRAEPFLIPAQLALAMLGMGATLSVRDFRDIVRFPAGLAIGYLTQLLFIPALGLLFIWLFGLGPGWAVGLILLTAVPGGAFSNLLTFFARGNVPLSIAVTTITTVSCIVTVPLVIRVFAAQHMPPEFVFPAARIIMEIIFYLLIPLASGMLLFRFLRGGSEGISRWAIRASMLLVVVIALGAMGSGKIKIPEYGWGPPLLIVAFALVMHVATAQLCRVLGRYDEDTVTLTIEVTVRNVPVGLLVYHHFFAGQAEQGHVLYTLLFYAGLSGPLSLPLLLKHRFGKGGTWLGRPKPRPKLDRDGAALPAHASRP